MCVCRPLGLQEWQYTPTWQPAEGIIWCLHIPCVIGSAMAIICVVSFFWRCKWENCMINAVHRDLTIIRKTLAPRKCSSTAMSAVLSFSLLFCFVCPLPPNSLWWEQPMHPGSTTGRQSFGASNFRWFLVIHRQYVLSPSVSQGCVASLVVSCGITCACSQGEKKHLCLGNQHG